MRLSPNASSSLAWLLLPLTIVGLTACQPSDDHADADHADEAEHDHAAAGADTGAMDEAPRVFFVEPENHAQVTSPVKLVFGAENFGIEPVGEGAVHAGMGHYHIGIDTDCLEPGIVIPQAQPWVHFGDGSSEIEVQLPPGEHTIVLQIGDGEHRTLDEPGLCSEVMVHVEESA